MMTDEKRAFFHAGSGGREAAELRFNLKAYGGGQWDNPVKHLS